MAAVTAPVAPQSSMLHRIIDATPGLTTLAHGLGVLAPADEPASPFLDAAASDLDVPTPHLAVALAGVLKADPVWGVHKLTVELAGFFAATEEALPTPLLEDLGIKVGKPVDAVAEALAHHVAGPLHALAREVATHLSSRAISGAYALVAGLDAAADTQPAAWGGDDGEEEQEQEQEEDKQRRKEGGSGGSEGQVA